MSTRTLSEEIYSRLRIDIRSGILEPGAHLRMEWLKSTYSIGATPLREALSRLSAEHLVTLEGGRGFRVADISLKEFEELLFLREDIEHKALTDAMAKGNDEWETNIVACFYSLSKMPWHLVSNDPRELEEREIRHRAFHTAIIAACDSTWLVRLWDQLTSHEERYRRIAMQGGGWPASISDDVELEHKQIVEAVVSRDIERSWAILQRHRRRTVEAVRNAFANHAKTRQEIVGIVPE